MLIIPASYALSRRKFIFRRKVLFLYVLLTQVGGGLGIALLIGLYAVYVQVGLNNSKLALAVYYAATAVPFNTWLLKTYMDGIPVSYEEAAVVDGAPPWRVVTEVILPLSAAGLATVFIFTFLTGWTEFVVAQTLLGTENYTLPVGLYSLVDEYSIPWARFSAFALVFASPSCWCTCSRSGTSKAVCRSAGWKADRRDARRHPAALVGRLGLLFHRPPVARRRFVRVNDRHWL